MSQEKQQSNNNQGKEKKRIKTEIARKPFRLPVWLRLFNIFIGFVFLSISSWIIVNADLSVSTATNLLGFVLVLIGVTRVINAFYDKHIGGSVRIVRFYFGASLLLIGLFIFIIPDLDQDATLMLLGIGLIIQGFGRIYLGLNHEILPFWTRWLIIIIGCFTALIGMASLSSAQIQLDEDQEIVNLLSIGFLLSGVARMVMGIAGYSAEKRKM